MNVRGDYAMKDLLLKTGYFIDNEYLDSYVKLVESNAVAESSVGTQIHHILPRCYFLLINESIDNTKENLVVLSYKDHILAHYYLALCTKSNLRYKLETAFIMLCNFNSIEEFNPENLSSYQEIYESVIKGRKGVSPPNKGRPMSEEQKSKISKSHIGKKASQEAREKMRKAALNMSPEKRAKIAEANRNKNYIPTEETRSKTSESLKGHAVSAETRRKIGEGNKKQLGNRWYTNGEICILVRPSESIPEGFHKGTLRGGTFWFNNGTEELRAVECPEGFKKGRLKHNGNKE